MWRFRKQYCWLIFFLGSIAQGEELFDLFPGVRPKGMGGAFTAVADDQNSFWTNPAGISRIRKARSRGKMHLFTFPNVIVGANNNGQSFYNNLQKTRLTTSAKDLAPAIAKTLGSSPEFKGKMLWARVAANPVMFLELWKNKPIAFGAFSNNVFKTTILPGESDAIALESINDYGGIIGISWTNKTNRVNFGFNLRPTSRFAYDDKIPISAVSKRVSLEKRITSDGNKTSGLGADLGMIWTFADFWFPSIGFSVLNLPTGCESEYLNPFSQIRQNICGTKFSGNIKNPDSLYLIDPTDLRVGLSITPRITRQIALRFAFDVHHITISNGDTHYGLPDIDPAKMLHGGVELFVGNPLKRIPLAVRTGYSQGFVSFGATLRVGVLTLELARYSKDTAAQATAIEDKRTILTGSMEFEFRTLN